MGIRTVRLAEQRGGHDGEPLSDRWSSWGAFGQGYRQNADFRDGLEGGGIGIGSVVAVRSDVTVHPHDAQPTAPARWGNGRRPQRRYRDKPPPVTAPATRHSGRPSPR